jgi:hypothetical protein
MGFCRQEVVPDPKRLAYARRCWPHVRRTSPTAAEFLRGEAQGARLDLDTVVLLSLHEEIVHQPHCTAFIATGKATRGGKTIVAQNWDWRPNLYPWAGLLRLELSGMPRAALYHYPGLWACAGVNDAGLSLMWTGGGYLPKVPPIVGVPTYVLIAEIMTRRSVDDAIAYLESLTPAGCFLFFLGDASGAAAIVEGAAGRIVFDRSAELMHRANHYTCPEIVRCSNQQRLAATKREKKKRPSLQRHTTVERYARMGAVTQRHCGQLTATTAKSILTERHGPWPWLHQFPASRDKITMNGMTIDSLFAVCEDRTLHTCRGGREPGPWQSVTV